MIGYSSTMREDKPKAQEKRPSRLFGPAMAKRMALLKRATKRRTE